MNMWSGSHFKAFQFCNPRAIYRFVNTDLFSNVCKSFAIIITEHAQYSEIIYYAMQLALDAIEYICCNASHRIAQITLWK